jgi:hypothetical protein
MVFHPCVSLSPSRVADQNATGQPKGFSYFCAGLANGVLSFVGNKNNLTGFLQFLDDARVAQHLFGNPHQAVRQVILQHKPQILAEFFGQDGRNPECGLCFFEPIHFLDCHLDLPPVVWVKINTPKILPAGHTPLGCF